MPAPADLPLFPLNTVLFPRMPLPLHIFEDRYLQMIEACLAGDETFGVVRIRSGREVGGSATGFEIGTSARITGVQRRPDGRLDIAVEGVRRFRMVSTVQLRPYQVASVEWLDDEMDLPGLVGVLEPAAALARACLLKVLALNNEWARKLPLPPEPDTLAYLIAERLPVDLDAKQSLLEAPTVAERLRRALPMLEAERSRLDQMLLQRQWMEAGRQN